jgi:hypothetical protein
MSMPFQQRIWASESFAWQKYPTLLAQTGFHPPVAAWMLVQEVLRHRQRLALIALSL